MILKLLFLVWNTSPFSRTLKGYDLLNESVSMSLRVILLQKRLLISELDNCNMVSMLDPCCGHRCARSSMCPDPTSITEWCDLCFCKTKRFGSIPSDLKSLSAWHRDKDGWIDYTEVSLPQDVILRGAKVHIKWRCILVQSGFMPADLSSDWRTPWKSVSFKTCRWAEDDIWDSISLKLKTEILKAISQQRLSSITWRRMSHPIFRAPLWTLKESKELITK